MSISVRPDGVSSSTGLSGPSNPASSSSRLVRLRGCTVSVFVLSSPSTSTRARVFRSGAADGSVSGPVVPMVTLADRGGRRPGRVVLSGSPFLVTGDFPSHPSSPASRFLRPASRRGPGVFSQRSPVHDFLWPPLTLRPDGSGGPSGGAGLPCGRQPDRRVRSTRLRSQLDPAGPHQRRPSDLGLGLCHLVRSPMSAAGRGDRRIICVGDGPRIIDARMSLPFFEGGGC